MAMTSTMQQAPALAGGASPLRRPSFLGSRAPFVPQISFQQSKPSRVMPQALFTRNKEDKVRHAWNGLTTV